MNRNEAIAYLTRCADDNGNHWHGGRSYSLEDCPTCHGTNDASHLLTPGSRYGYRSGDVAPIAYRHAVLEARKHGIPASKVSESMLGRSMSWAVNDSDAIESDLQGYAAELAGASIDAMVDGYLDAQLWAGLDYEHERCGDDCDVNSEPHPWDDHYSREDISDEYVDAVRAEFAALVYEHPLAVRMYLNHRAYYHTGENGVIVRKRRTEPEYDAAQFGHDFYLTREGHGAGFWDRGLGELGDYLTKLSEWAGRATDLDDRGDGVLR